MKENTTKIVWHPDNKQCWDIKYLIKDLVGGNALPW